MTAMKANAAPAISRPLPTSARGDSQREDTQWCSLEALVGEDPSQDRERGHRHRDAEEQGERGERYPLGRQARVEADRQRGPEEEGDDDAGVGDRDRRPRMAAQEPQIELQSYQEHEQDHAELGDHAERRGGLEREDPRRELGPEQRGAEEDPRQHLPDHGGLAEGPQDAPQQPSDEDDSAQREQDMGEDLDRWGGADDRARGSRRSGSQRLAVGPDQEEDADRGDQDAAVQGKQPPDRSLLAPCGPSPVGRRRRHRMDRNQIANE
jgi:hypothetical protein